MIEKTTTSGRSSVAPDIDLDPAEQRRRYDELIALLDQWAAEDDGIPAEVLDEIDTTLRHQPLSFGVPDVG